MMTARALAGLGRRRAVFAGNSRRAGGVLRNTHQRLSQHSNQDRATDERTDSADVHSILRYANIVVILVVDHLTAHELLRE